MKLTKLNNMIFSPKEIQMYSARYGLRPSKAYGQHYLVSTAPIKKMLEAAELMPDDVVIEVGPGFGVLTLAIAPRVREVIAFEIEQKLRQYWEERKNQFPNVQIIWGNVLSQFSHFISSFPHREKYKVLSNLPYQITSDALRLFLECEHPPERMVVMVQKEVAERIVACPPKMSLLAVSVQYYGDPSIVVDVPRGSFWPVPKVDSAVLRIERRSVVEQQTKKQADAFFAVVRAGFSHKRKQVWNNLSAGLHIEGDAVKRVLRGAVGNDKIRAEEISVEEWQKIEQKLFE